jgi:dihydroorotate dehydrogenase electron transfer subunit
MIAPDFCKITFAAPAIAQKAEPGQFCMIYMPSDRGFMLPRPLSIFSADRTEGKLSFFYKKVGRGTKYLSQTEPGSYLKLLGPLGNSFPPAESGALMVAGGMGLAPLAFLISSSTVPLTLIHAAKTAEELVSPLAEVPTAEVNIVAVTEDGSEGRRGSALDIACEYLPGTKTLYACGPTAMLQSLAQVCRSRGIQAWLSLEEKMACGIGACRGCSVQTNSGYSRVCHDGPVFSAGEVYPDA